MSLHLDGDQIQIVKEEVKLLSFIFDKLSFVPHYKCLEEQVTEALYVKNVATKSKWGTDKITLLHLYCFLVRYKKWVWIG